MTPTPSHASSYVARAVLAALAVLLVAASAAHLVGGLRGPSGARDVGGAGDTVSLGRHHGHHHEGRGHATPHGAPRAQLDENTGFDFYVYSMSHQPEFCRENGERFAGCRAPREEWQGQLTIHGLWPSRDDGTWPSSCTSERFNVTLLESLSEELAHNWPNIKALSPDAKGHTSFWEHEWTKHGTCSGLRQQDYFARALDLLLRTPGIVKEKYGATVTREELAADPYLGGDMSIFACRSGYLSEVRVCYARRADGAADGVADGAVGERASCPASMLREDTCGDVIKIAAFDADRRSGLDWL